MSKAIRSSENYISLQITTIQVFLMFEHFNIAVLNEHFTLVILESFVNRIPHILGIEYSTSLGSLFQSFDHFHTHKNGKMLRMFYVI